MWARDWSLNQRPITTENGRVGGADAQPILSGSLRGVSRSLFRHLPHQLAIPLAPPDLGRLLTTRRRLRSHSIKESLHLALPPPPRHQRRDSIKDRRRLSYRVRDDPRSPVIWRLFWPISADRDLTPYWDRVSERQRRFFFVVCVCGCVLLLLLPACMPCLLPCVRW